MIVLTLDELILLHEKLILATGGSQGVRDIGLLESALFGCYQSFDGKDLYPTIIEKAARMAYAICNNHPFVDGNKRTAIASMLVTLRMNDVTMLFTQQELVVLGLGIADGSIDYEGIVEWLAAHQENQDNGC
jgi:death-on-curing protein